MTTSQIDRDRRRFPRRPQRFVVEYRPIGGAHQHEAAFRKGMVLNVSNGGLVLACGKEFPRETLFEIRIPETPLGPPRDVRGKAVWTHEASQDEYQVGCMFVRIVMPEADTDRRQFPRQPHKLPLSVCAVEESDSHEGHLQDLSQGGIEFLCRAAYDAGTIVQVGFPESPLGGGRVVFVQVVRRSRAEGGGWYRVAGKFVDA